MCYGGKDPGFRYPYDVAISPADASFALVANSGNNKVARIDLNANAVTFYAGPGFKNPYGIAIAHDGSFALVANYRAINVARIDLHHANAVTFILSLIHIRRCPRKETCRSRSYPNT